MSVLLQHSVYCQIISHRFLYTFLFSFGTSYLHTSSSGEIVVTDAKNARGLVSSGLEIWVVVGILVCLECIVTQCQSCPDGYGCDGVDETGC